MLCYEHAPGYGMSLLVRGAVDMADGWLMLHMLVE